MTTNDWTEWTTEELIEQLGARPDPNGDTTAHDDIVAVLTSRGVTEDEIEAATR